ncbi:MAG: hypothetical protein KDD89_09725, partial [Anaerolineales bacterium]|nr:hypothetical protein [Anaerolineales bacterium]
MRDCEATSAGHCHCSVDAPQQNGPRPCRHETPAPTANLIQALPAHLGWDSSRYTQIVREKAAHGEADGSGVGTAVADSQPEEQSPSEEPHLHIFGHVLDRLQQDGLEGAGRVWLLLRFLDRQQGQGRVSLELARHMLTSKHSAYRCLSWKRLRQVLNEGEGIFWHRDKKRWHVYYHSEVRVAQALGLAAIRG